MTRLILLSFDVEEFDLPVERGRKIAEDVQLDVSRRGLERVLNLLDSLHASATLFVTGHFARAQPELIRQAGQRHEIASHGMTHGELGPNDLAASRRVLERISSQAVIGFRRPRMQHTEAQALLEAGYQYDASEHPTWLPGRYNNLRQPRTAYRRGELVVVPASVTPRLRLPLFWLSFKNVPLGWYRRAAERTLRHDGYLCLYFHPWEFAELRGMGVPRYIRRVEGHRLVSRLGRTLRDLREEGEFATMRSFVETFGKDDE